METATIARPDLSTLPRGLRVRIAVAQMQGWRWEPEADGYWWLIGPRGEVGASAAPGRPVTEGPQLPWWLTDPAAWGALMQQEGVALMQIDDGNWLATVPKTAAKWHPVRFLEGLVLIEGVLAVQDTPGEAVCAAILMKDGIDWPWATPEPVA